MPPLDSCIRLPDPPRMSAPPLVSTRRPMPSTPQPPSSNVSSALLSPLDNQVAAVTTARRTHVRRPRNPFILFRCDFVKRNLVPASVERDHRNVSSIAGARWQQMSEEEKQPWKDLAAEEKIRHALEHPGYRYKPAARASGDSRKQRSKRGADDDPEKVRCREIARLIGDGIVGEQLKKVLSDASAALKAPQPAALTRRRSSSCPPLRFPRQISHTHHHPSSSFSTPCSNFLQPGNSYFSSPWEMSSYYYMPQVLPDSGLFVPQVSSRHVSPFISAEMLQTSSSVTSTPYLYDGIRIPSTPVPDIHHFDSSFLYTPTSSHEFKTGNSSLQPQLSAGIFMAQSTDEPLRFVPTATCNTYPFGPALDEQLWRRDVTEDITLLSPLALLPPENGST